LASRPPARRRSHIRVAFQNQNFIQVGIFRRHFFGGTISIAIKPLCCNGFIRFSEKPNHLASQLQMELRPAAFLFAPERHENVN
jgi:hypothetical protein